MKRTQKLSWLFAIMLFAGSTKSFSQTLKEFFSNTSTPLTYLGIDYTKARLINEPGATASDINGRLAAINTLVLAEPDNFKIGSAFNRSEAIINDITAVNEKNEKINGKEIISSKEADYNRLTEADIAATVKGLNLKQAKGIGLVFIMDGMRKEEKKGLGSVWVTLIDMETKTVLMTERMEQEAAGFSVRNYWASVIKRTIVEIDKKKYKAWKSKHSS